MNETQTTARYPRPPRLVHALINPVVTAILRSSVHGLASKRLLLITFTGRKSGKAFTTPITYAPEGNIVRLRVAYPWWKNLREQPTVRVLLRGKLRAGTAEVFPEAGGVVVVNIHLKE